ncbi:MAG: ATP-binding cassette domain-containing protein [Gammaproteobacteria bacterium]|nr:ATP-binding cassette domain-containing protein [Gammaproteobacteria bacterium]
MPLLTLSDAHLAFGTHVLLDGANVSIEAGQKIGLLGRNGAGKSTFLRVIQTEQALDSGELWIRPGVRVASLSQELPPGNEQSVYQYVANGLEPLGELLARFFELSHQSDVDLDELGRLQTQIEAKDGWTLNQRVERTLSDLGLDGNAKMSSLSGGWRRRVGLARAFVTEPDLLILDEPTNHLDLPTIAWLEEQLKAFRGAILVVTHDRAFLQSIATQIIEIDRGNLIEWTGDYQGFLKHKEHLLKAEESANALFDKRLAQEEVWIRQGIKARRTRNEGRVRALKAMRDERAGRRERSGDASFSVESSDQSGKIVSELEHVTVEYGNRRIIDDFSTKILRGDKIGIIGANGAGKTTLIKAILGMLEPTSGNIKLGTKLNIAYFDQTRGNLDPSKTLLENICDGRDFIEIDGKQRHGISYLQDFLFTPDRLRQPIESLSGGEQNRAILAKIFSKPANLLVLDEPTNDLDMETLELLEEILLDFEGTVLLVSHDREFMNNVVTSTMWLDGSGKVREYVGGYDDWIRQGGRFDSIKASAKAKLEVAPTVNSKPAAKPASTAAPKKKKLSFKDQRELEALPGQIEAAENDIAALEAEIADPSFFSKPHSESEPIYARLSELQEQLEGYLERWMELESDD